MKPIINKKNSIKIIIKGTPIPKKRHRTFVRGTRVCTYDPQGKEKKDTAQQIKNQLLLKNGEIAENASNLLSADFYDVRISFHMLIPKSLSKSKRSLLLWNLKHSNKPDIDNMAKFILDVANGILWEDDRKIASLTLEKNYSDDPKVEIEVTPMKSKKISSRTKKVLEIFSPEMFGEMIDEILKHAAVLSTEKTSDEEQVSETIIKLSKYYKELELVNKKVG